MSKRVLLVDDEVNVLQGYQRALRKRFRLEVATGGAEALEKIADEGPFAVIVSDMRMPAMDGVQLLATVKERAPDTVRMMLTGNSDQQTAIDAINHGDIFRFLNKPCDKDALTRALEAGIRQYDLITAEKELLQKTLAGSVRVLAEVLALADPAAFGRTVRLRKLTVSIVEQLGIEREWWLEPLVLLSQIGCVTLPENVSKRIAVGQSLNTEEYRLYARHPQVGADLLVKIPRMEQISAAVRYQEKNFDGTGIPHDGVQGMEIPLGSRILRVALDYDRGDAEGLSPQQCLARMYRRKQWYDARILEALRKAVIGEAPMQSRRLHIRDLEDGMVLAQNVRESDGMLLVAKGFSVTASVRQRLENYHDNGKIPGLVTVVAFGNPPAGGASTAAVANE
jgi:response regulator RpfG family c-di-GMP phosphodiesterase